MGLGWSLLLPLEVDAKTKSWVWDGLTGQLAPMRSLKGERGEQKKRKKRVGARVYSSPMFMSDTFQQTFIHWKLRVIPRRDGRTFVFVHHRGVRWGTGSEPHKYLVRRRLWMDPGGVNTAGGSLRTGHERRLLCTLIPHLEKGWTEKEKEASSVTIVTVVVPLSNMGSIWFLIGRDSTYLFCLTECDVVQLHVPKWTVSQDDSAYSSEPSRTGTGVELLELSVLRSLRVKWQPCALQFYLQEVAQSRTQGDPERDPLHPGLASPSEALLSREAGVLRAAVHARPVQRHDRGGGGGGDAAAGRREELQCQGSRALQESVLQPPACRVLSRGTAVPSGPSAGPQARAHHSARHQLSQWCRHGDEFCQFR